MADGKRDGWCTECKCHHVHNSFGEPLHHPKECPKIAKEKKPTTLVVFHGKDGKCTNSPFGGHIRYSGKKTAKMMGRSMFDIQVPEFRTSQTCACCGEKVEPAKRAVVVNGEIVMRKVHGALVCSNPDCQDFKNHRSNKMRDGLSCKCLSSWFIFIQLRRSLMVAMDMKIMGISMALSDDGQPMAPFRRGRSSGNNESITKNTNALLDTLQAYTKAYTREIPIIGSNSGAANGNLW
jgi:hypothetical protein